MSRIRILTSATPITTIYIHQQCPTCGQSTTAINGRWLRLQRENAGLDQRSFGKIVGVSGPYISDIERNRREAPPHIVKAYTKLRATRRGRHH